jgi:hypothetical protein
MSSAPGTSGPNCLRLEIYPEVWDRKPECCASLGARWEAVMSALRAQCVGSCGPFCLG